MLVKFKKVDELAEIWCEWAEMEVRNEYVFIFVQSSGSDFLWAQKMLM